MTEFKTGQTVELHTPAHCYQDRQLGLSDPNYVIAAKTDTMRVARVTRAKGEVRLTLKHADGTGYGIVVSHWLRWRDIGRTIRVVGA